MSICPSKDLHSVFVDGELPVQFQAEYLAHIESCPICKETVEKLQTLRSSFANDSQNIKLSSQQIEDGYKKLEQRLNFKRVTTASTPRFEFSQFIPMMNRLVPAVAAALIIALFLPIGIKKAFSPNSGNSFSQDSIAQVWDAQNSINLNQTLTSQIVSSAMAENRASLIETAENLRNVNLENIINENSSANIYAPLEEIICSSSSPFKNVYNSQQNQYNVVYSPFAGFNSITTKRFA